MKTVEEEIKTNIEIRDKLIDFRSEFNVPNHSYKHGFEDGVWFAQRWIPIEEELPTFGDVVLCKSNNLCDKYTTAYFTNTRLWLQYPSDELVSITHWRKIELK